MLTIIITGGTGFIGKALTKKLLEKGYHVIILTRKKAGYDQTVNLRYATWNPEQKTIDKEAVASADYIVHLAGAGVAEKRWTKKRKQEIILSRVESSKLIMDSLRTIPNKVKAVISASGIGWYLTPDPSSPGGGGNGLRKLIESDPVAKDFLGTVCKQWEESIEPVASLGKRLVIMRIGIVLSKEGGALKEFIRPLRYGIAAILGRGRQIISWIHMDDLVNMFIRGIENDKMTGVYNAVAPGPVSNKELIISLAKARKKFYIPFHVPSFLIKWMLGEMSTEVLKSVAVSCEKIQRAGFIFQHPAIRVALENIIENPGSLKMNRGI